jgi:hypothetical protein
MREGWEPVLHSEHPELITGTQPQGQYKNNIEIGGLLLCKAPKELMEQRQAYIDNKTKSQTEAVDAAYLNQNDPRKGVKIKPFNGERKWHLQLVLMDLKP